MDGFHSINKEWYFLAAKKVPKECGIVEALRNCSRENKGLICVGKRYRAGMGRNDFSKAMHGLALPYVPLPQRIFDSMCNVSAST